MRKIIFIGLFFIISSISFARAQSFSTGYIPSKGIFDSYLKAFKKEPRYQSCCICQFYDGADIENWNSASLRCDDWLAKKSCSFKTKIRASLPLSPQNLFPYADSYQEIFSCGNTDVVRFGHGKDVLDAGKAVEACVMMTKGNVSVEDRGCSVFENTSRISAAVDSIRKVLRSDQEVSWIANQSYLFYKDAKEKSPVYYGETPIRLNFTKTEFQSALPQCSVLNQKFLRGILSCDPKDTNPVWCQSGGVSMQMLCCPAVNPGGKYKYTGYISWIPMPLSGKCPDTPTYAVPFVTPQF